MLKGVLGVEQLARPVPGGIGVHVRAVLSALVALERTEGLALYAGAEIEGPAGWRGARLGARLPARWAQPLWDLGAVRLPRYPGFYHAFSFGGPRLPEDRPVSLTVHDLLFRDLPDVYPARARRWHEKRLAGALASSAVLVAVSEETRSALVAAGAVRERIRVIPPGADHLPPADPEAAERVLDRLGVAGRYLLVVGTLEPRKNLVRIFEAYKRYRAATFDPLPLVVVGPKGWGPDVVAPLGACLAGYLPARTLAGVLARAWAFVYAPLEEGLGLPVLEALHAAVPVVTSVSVPARRFGGLAVDPRSVEALAEALRVVTEDDRARAELVTHGLLAVEGLTWRGTALAYLQLWEELAA